MEIISVNMLIADEIIDRESVIGKKGLRQYLGRESNVVRVEDEL